MVNLMALHYDAQTAAWEPPRTVYRDQTGGFHRVRIAFRAGDAAVLNFIDTNTPAGEELSSRLFDGVAWDLDKLPIPGSPVSAFHETASDGGEVLMWYGENMTSATWLRDLAP